MPYNLGKISSRKYLEEINSERKVSMDSDMNVRLDNQTRLTRLRCWNIPSSNAASS